MVDIKWIECNLKSVCNFTSGFSFKVTDFVTNKIGVPVVKVKNILDGRIDYRNLDFVQEKNTKNVLKAFSEDIFIAKNGSLAGKVGILIEKSLFYFDANVVRIRTKSDSLDQKFLCCSLLDSKRSISHCVMCGAIPHMNMQKLQSLKIWIPPLEEQKRIVRILDKFSELERELERELEHRKKQYEYYRKLLIKGPAYSPPRNKYEFKEYQLEDLCENVNGINRLTDFNKDGIPVVLAKNIKDAKIMIENLSYCSAKALDSTKISFISHERYSDY